MKSAILIAVTLLLAACTATRPIADLGLPPVSIIEGKVSDMTADGFLLTDASGTIDVRVVDDDGVLSNIVHGDSLKVYGNLMSGKTPQFDAYVLEKPDGVRYILTPPTPHVGIVIQSSFT